MGEASATLEELLVEVRDGIAGAHATDVCVLRVDELRLLLGEIDRLRRELERARGEVEIVERLSGPPPAPHDEVPTWRQRVLEDEGGTL